MATLPSPDYPPIRPDGSMPLRRVGRTLQTEARDLYHGLLTLRWGTLIALLVAAYMLSNVVFGALYLLLPGSIRGATPGSYLDAFNFSVHTMATIGYGTMTPATPYANALVAVEALYGLMGTAVATGLFFAKLSAPTARVLFSRVAVISPERGRPTLMFRMVNARDAHLVEARVRATLVLTELDEHGDRLRRFYDLRLRRSSTPLFSLSWTAKHVIGRRSPLYGLSPEELRARGAVLIVTFTGLDDTLAVSVHTRHAWNWDQVRYDHRFVDIVEPNVRGEVVIDYSRFHDTVPVRPAPTAAGTPPPPAGPPAPGAGPPGPGRGPGSARPPGAGAGWRRPAG